MKKPRLVMYYPQGLPAEVREANTIGQLIEMLDSSIDFERQTIDKGYFNGIIVCHGGKNLKQNRIVNGRVICGSFFIAKRTQGLEFEGLTDMDFKRLMMLGSNGIIKFAE